MAASEPGSLTGPARAATTTACQGEDIFNTLRAREPDQLRAIEQRAGEMPFRRGRLYRITSGATAPSYLLGTLHLSDPRVTRWSKAVADMLVKASVVVVETTDLDMRDNARRKEDLRDAIAAKPGHQPEELLDPAAFDALVALGRAHGLPEASAKTFKPGALALLLDQPVCAVRDTRAKPYLDALLMQDAREAGTTVVGLETLAEQFNAVDGLSVDVERTVLRSLLRNADDAENVIETQIRRYDEGDLGALVAWMKAPANVPGAGTPPEFLERVLRLRTQRMNARLAPILARGNAFVAIGAAHLPDTDGLLSLLTGAGYTIERVD